jgi:dienelactone hydrolase
VLIGHGASGHKRESYVVALARRFARTHAIAALSIDGPVHGDRRSDGSLDVTLPFLEFAQLWSSDPAMTDRSSDDWRSVLDAVLRSGDVPPTVPVGYWGLSMGTILGLPFVASEPRIAAAVLGLMGATGPTRERIVESAQQVAIPLLFLMQWDDELFSRSDALALFDTFASTRKSLLAGVGAHGAVSDEHFAYSADFLVRHLTSRV